MALKSHAWSSGNRVKDREQCCETKWGVFAGDLGVDAGGLFVLR